MIFHEKDSHFGSALNRVSHFSNEKPYKPM